MKKHNHSFRLHQIKAAQSKKKRTKKYIPNSKILLYYHNLHEDLLIDQQLKNDNSKVLKAPENFCFVENAEECLNFFNLIRGGDYLTDINDKKYIQLDLKSVKKIDYGTICVLKAILYEIEFKSIVVRGNFPEDIECKNFILESGFLNYLVDEKGRNFRKTKNSEIVFFLKSADEFSDEEMKKLGDKIKMIMEHLTGVRKHNQSLRSMILEVCGNSIEHSQSLNNYWIIGFYFEKDKVKITVTDIGVGILETLYIKHTKKILDLLTVKSDLGVLKGAFLRKYGSSTLEDNRNKGLPLIQKTNEERKIENLVVITNSVILQFNDESKSRVFKQNSKFFGTFYQWEISTNCIF